MLVHRLFDEFEIFHDFSELCRKLTFDLISSVVEHTVRYQQHKSQPLALVGVITILDARGVDEDSR